MNGQCVLSVRGFLEKSKINFISLAMDYNYSGGNSLPSEANNYYLIQSADSLWYVKGVSDLSDLDKGQRSLMMHHPNLKDNYLDLIFLSEPFPLTNIIFVHDDNRSSCDSEIKGDSLIYRYKFGVGFEAASGVLKFVKNSGMVELDYRYENYTNLKETITLSFKESGSL